MDLMPTNVKKEQLKGGGKVPLSKYKKRTKQFVQAGVGLGAGSLIISKMGSGVSPAYLGTMGGMMRPMGAAVGGMAVMGLIGGIVPKKRKKRYRR